MPVPDAATLGRLLVQLGLVSTQSLEEAWREVDRKEADGNRLLRHCERKGLITPYQSSKLLKGDTEGYLIGGYRLLYKVASGSFGRVFRADDPRTNRVVAIKILRRKWTEDQRTIDLFLREGRMGMSLTHPNIVEILAVNYDRPTNQFYIVMEFVEGGNLRDFLTIQRKLEAREVARILEESTQALAFAFSRGVTHRDIKLTNILLSSRGQAKLVDFGLAGGQVGFDGSQSTSVDRTVDYAGLEKSTSAPAGDPRSDLFFLGCVAYELLTGRPPLSRKVTGQARLKAERFASIPPIEPGEAPAPLIKLVESMMILDPDRRVQTPTQLLDRIKAVRGELEPDGTNGERKTPRTIFLAERDESLQNILRTKLKEKGFKVLIASDPLRALDRFRSGPFDLLIVNMQTTGEEGFYVFEKIMEQARRSSIPCSGILMLGDDQAEWKKKLDGTPGVQILQHPVTFKQLSAAIQALLA